MTPNAFDCDKKRTKTEQKGYLRGNEVPGYKSDTTGADNDDTTKKGNKTQQTQTRQYKSAKGRYYGF